jgi:probable rRNA maturation factor
VVDDDTIRALNRAYRGKDRPTDVLSFPLDDGSGEFVLPPGAPRHLGAIVVSLPRALEQAREYGHSPAREFGYLVTHGLLHLLGYDHEAPEEQRAMRAREEAALLAVGLAR